MKILGIDPGIARPGGGVIKKANGKLASRRSGGQMAHCGCVETSKTLPLEIRIKSLYDQLSRIINEERPDSVAIEELFFNTNAKTALIVGQARGVILLSAAEANLPVAVYTPLQVKIAITGYGRAEKMQVEKMVMVQLGLKEKPKLDDISDALAIALTHAFSRKMYIT